MRYIALLTANSIPAGPSPGELFTAIAQLGEQATKAGALVDTAGLAPSAAGTRVTLNGGNTSTTDGIFTKDLASYAIYDVASEEEVVEWASRFLDVHAEHWPGWDGEVQVLKVLGPEDFGPAAWNLARARAQVTGPGRRSSSVAPRG